MGQQRNAQTPKAVDAPEAEDDASFLSPEEAASIIDSLEERDNLLLGSRNSESLEDEGNFISPEDVEAQASGFPTGKRDASEERPSPREDRGQKAPRAAENLQSDLLARIAGELRSIKSDLGTLKNNYDDMISKASSIAGGRPAAESPPASAQEREPEAAGQFIPEKSLEEIKSLLGYLDRLLESLPEAKIDEFARSEYFELYRKIFEFFSLV